jgi:hypothetical protein
MTFERDILPYYPGDSLVDVVGVDGYNFGDHYDRWHHWQEFAEIFAASLRACRSFNKPLWVTETACATDSRRVAWVESMLGYLDRNLCIEALFWFDVYKDIEKEPDFRLGDGDSAAALMREWLVR